MSGPRLWLPNPVRTGLGWLIIARVAQATPARAASDECESAWTQLQAEWEQVSEPELGSDERFDGVHFEEMHRRVREQPELGADWLRRRIVQGATEDWQVVDLFLRSPLDGPAAEGTRFDLALAMDEMQSNRTRRRSAGVAKIQVVLLFAAESIEAASSPLSKEADLALTQFRVGVSNLFRCGVDP